MLYITKRLSTLGEFYQVLSYDIDYRRHFDLQGNTLNIQLPGHTEVSDEIPSAEFPWRELGLLDTEMYLAVYPDQSV